MIERWWPPRGIPIGGVGNAGGVVVIPPPVSLLAAYLADNPVRLWRVGEVAGPTAFDTMGLGNATVAGGGLIFAQPSLINTDPANTCVKLVRATAGWLQFVVNAGIPVGNAARTIEVWTKATTVLALNGVITYGGAAPGSFGLREDAGGNIVFTDGLTDTALSVGGPVNDLLRHQIVVAYDGVNTVQGFVDGVPLLAAVVGPLNTTTPSNGFIGVSGNFFDGFIDEIAIFPTRLSNAKILVHWNIGK